MSAPVWSKIETHCVVCARPFATEADLDRHAEKECDVPCWCIDVCWVEYGGDCGPSAEIADDDADELGLYRLYRAWRERAETTAEFADSALRPSNAGWQGNR
jgi:hypothetical protein